MASNKGPAVRLGYRDAVDSAERVRYDAKNKADRERIAVEFDRSDWNDDVKLLPSTQS